MDDFYVLPLMVLWHSLHQTSSVPREANIYILHEDSLSSKSLHDLRSFFQIYAVTPSFIDMNGLLPAALTVGYHFTRAIYYRLYVSSILPKELDSVVYLDVDTIAVKTIEPLFTASVEKVPIAAADHLSIHDQLRLWGITGGNYFNSGVLIINLNLWRAVEIEKRFQDILLKDQARIRWGDQDVLNIAFANQWGRIPIWFNANHIVNQAVGMEAVVNHAHLIHYTGARKPWNAASPAPHELLWIKCLSELNECYPLGELASRVKSIDDAERLHAFASRKDLISGHKETA